MQEAYQIGAKPVTADIVSSVLPPSADELVSFMSRKGYGVKDLAVLMPHQSRSYLPQPGVSCGLQHLRSSLNRTFLTTVSAPCQIISSLRSLSYAPI
jgi:hypothetical protein